MTTKAQLREKFRARRVYNSYDFYNKAPYIYRTAGDEWHLAAWKVSQRGVDLNDGEGHWQDPHSRVFIIHGRVDVMLRLAEAIAWATERFGISEWIRGPYGDYGPKEWTAKRTAWILSQLPSSTMD